MFAVASRLSVAIEIATKTLSGKLCDTAFLQARSSHLGATMLKGEARNNMWCMHLALGFLVFAVASICVQYRSRDTEALETLLGPRQCGEEVVWRGADNGIILSLEAAGVLRISAGDEETGLGERDGSDREVGRCWSM